jgi:hypothetical protein
MCCQKKHAGKGHIGNAAYEEIIASSQRSRQNVNAEVIGEENCEDVLYSVEKFLLPIRMVYEI